MLDHSPEPTDADYDAAYDALSKLVDKTEEALIKFGVNAALDFLLDSDAFHTWYCEHSYLVDLESIVADYQHDAEISALTTLAHEIIKDAIEIIESDEDCDDDVCDECRAKEAANDA